MASRGIELIMADPNSYVDSDGNVLPSADLGLDYSGDHHGGDATQIEPEIDEPDYDSLYSDGYKAMKSALLAAIAEFRNGRDRIGFKINGRLPGEYIANEGRRAGLLLEETEELLRLVQDFRLGTTAFAAEVREHNRQAKSPVYPPKKYEGYDGSQRAAGEYLQGD